MQRLCGIALASFLVLIGVNLVHAGENDALAIVNKSIQAAGGEKALAKFNAVTFKDKGTFYGMGDDGLPYTGSYAIQYPGQIRMEIEGVFTIVLNGDKGWISSMGNTMEMTKDQIANQKHDLRAGYMGHLLVLKDKAFTLKKLADAKVDKLDTSVVQASRKDWPDVKLFFDKKTNLLAMIEFKSKAADMDFKEVTLEHIFSDYKDVAGAKVAHKVLMKRDGKRYVESEVVEMTAAGKLDAKMFAEPK